MRVLILGGNGFLGRPITHRLVALGVDVTVFHRGTGRAVDWPHGIHTIHGDRNRLDLSVEHFRRLRPDIVVDTLAFTQQQAELLMNAFAGAFADSVATASRLDSRTSASVLTNAGRQRPVGARRRPCDR